jgi:hypothetical protein
VCETFAVYGVVYGLRYGFDPFLGLGEGGAGLPTRRNGAFLLWVHTAPMVEEVEVE